MGTCKQTSTRERTRMVALFSERHGFTPIRTQLQHESADDHLRIGLWNVYYVMAKDWEMQESRENRLLTRQWLRFWKRPIDDMPVYGQSINNLAKERILRGEWYEVYNLIEFFAREVVGEDEEPRLYEWFNSVLEENMSPYRFVDGSLVEIDSVTDITAIEQALADTEAFGGAKEHLATALRLLANREDPDARLSIKESISAVESVAKVITDMPKATLTPALKKLQDSGVVLHEDQIEGWKKLYHYSSDAKGIRHAALEKPVVTVAEARYWLVSCSAFVSLLLHLWLSTKTEKPTDD